MGGQTRAVPIHRSFLTPYLCIKAADDFLATKASSTRSKMSNVYEYVVRDDPAQCDIFTIPLMFD